MALPVSGADTRHGSKDKTVDVQLLAINDFHGEPRAAGRLVRPDHDELRGPPATTPRSTPAASSTSRPTSRRWRRPTRTRRCSPPATSSARARCISALFHDEPTIEAMNKIGLDVNAVGNHEFDEGVYELMRMQYGGCHPTDGCQDGDAVRGRRLRFPRRERDLEVQPQADLPRLQGRSRSAASRSPSSGSSPGPRRRS